MTTVADRVITVPAPRRLTCCLGAVASVGVMLTSLDSPVWAGPGLGWVAAFIVGALLPRGDVVLTAVAALTKLATIALVVWSLSHPLSPIGPHGVLDWVPLGALNAATGVWLLRLIRGQAR
ncbi:MAG: hypothetical protein ABI746_07865 [Dermatophilaceae bacterium]